jgi:hypothetical protein
MTTHETPAAPRNTEEQLLRITGKHPSGFDSWQDLRGYLLDYNIIGHDDETCRLIEEAYHHWPNSVLCVSRNDAQQTGGA